MIRHGEPPFLECSSRGDVRFSAFFAKVRGKSIERRYQEAKVFEDGVDLTWRERAGCAALNQEECRRIYADLWDEYIDGHPELVPVLVAASGLSDVFGKKGHACQATELWRIRNNCRGEGNR
jgi:hypothetical protein